MKDNDKILILKLLLKATFVLLVISVFLKLLGLNVFGIDYSNNLLNKIASYLSYTNIKIALDFFLLVTQNFIFFRLATKTNKIQSVFYCSLITSILTLISQLFFYKVGNYIPSAIDIFLQYFVCFIFCLIIPFYIDRILFLTKYKTKIKINFREIIKMLKRVLLLIVLITLYQIIIIYIRNLTFSPAINSLNDLILNFDYTILLMSTYYVYLNNGFDMSFLSSNDFSIIKYLDKNATLEEIKFFVYKIKDFNKKFNESNKTDKIIVCLYIFFSCLSELINLSLVIFIACLNHALIECLFIITSFFISRKIFGAFHLDSAIKCWFMSNISFYLLSRLSFGIGISYVVPVLLGILLSYITSKFIKKTNKQLYRGIKETDLKEIVNGKKLTILEYQILEKYYCEGINMNKLTFIYHYSRAQLYRYKTNAEKKIAS